MIDDDDPGVVRGLARFLGGLMVDELTNGAVFISLIVAIAALITQNPPFVALGLAVGLAEIVLPWRAVHRGWPDSLMTLVVAAVLIADAATLWLLWQRA